MPFVYKHIRLDTNETFYIGIGKRAGRGFSVKSRNPHWINIVRKVKCVVDILHDYVDWPTALELEKFYIKRYGRKDLGSGTLVNMTDGGEGSIGRKVSNHVKQILNRTGKKHSPEAKLKMVNTRLTSLKCRGWKWSKESLENISKIRKGKTPWNKGRPWSEEVKNKIRGTKNGKRDKRKSKTDRTR
jgi:hypothetical protein